MESDQLEAELSEPTNGDLAPPEEQILFRAARCIRRRPFIGLAACCCAMVLFDAAQRWASTITLHFLMATMYAAALLVVAEAVACSRASKWSDPRIVSRVRRFSMPAAIALLTPTLLMGLHAFTFQPLKFTYLRHRLETARTAEEEKRALKMAFTFGRVWEAHFVGNRNLPARYRNVDAAHLYKIEWLATAPGGGPWRAYVDIIDTNNLREFGWRPSAAKPAADGD